MTCLVQNTTTPSVGDSSSGSGWAPLYGGGTHLDQEAIQYIHKFYCKDCRMEEEKAKAAAAAAGGDSPEGGGDTTDTPSEQPISPEILLEEMSLQQSMDKNKESLKRKLLMRRSVTELVDQGIYPPLKTPPAFAEQRKHLERAKTGDLLRHKIIHRPDRQLLVQQHILEDTKIDPSLHERQRLLKRARLADDLNEKLLHRPGPLDLIRGNILKTEDEMLTDAITDGVVQLQVPDNKDSKSYHFVFDDDSSEGAPSPSQTEESGMSDIGSPPVVPPAPDPPPLQLKSRQTTITTPTFNKMLNTQSIAVLNTPITSFTGSLSSSSSSKNGNSGNGINKVSRQKKSKPKTSAKSKVIKFHEYKGPPSASKSQVTSTVTSTSSSPQSSVSTTPPTSETKYHWMLQQQQLFLQWQLEFQQKNLPVPVTLLPQQKSETSTTVSPGHSVAGSVIITSAINSPPSFASSPPTVVQAQGVVPAQGLLPPQNVVPAQGMLSTPTVVPAQGMVPSQVATTVVSTSLLQSSTVPHTVIKQQPAQLQTVSQPPVQKVQQVQVQSGHSIVQKSGSQVRTHTHPVSQTHHSKTQSKSNHVVQKPFSNLEDMKVADLKLELKKRNLPVSGPKPQLIERLKPYVDVIIGVAQGSVSTSVANDNASSLVKRPVPTLVNVKSVPLTPLEETVCMQSPPCSPKTEQIITTTPLSPEIMDIAQSALNAQNKSGSLTLSQSSIPMAVDNSRPPSVAPMDINMDVDGPQDIRRFSPTDVSQAVTPPVSAIVTSPKPQSQPQLQAQPQPQPVKQANSPPGATPQISSEILLQQQRRIAQLQKELEESQMRLKLQQMQHHHLQQQQRHLQQQQTTYPTQQPASPPQLSQQPNSPPQQVIQQIIQQPTSPPQFIQPSPQPTPPPQIIHTITSQPNSPPMILQQPISPPQSVQQPISPPQLIQQPISPPQQPLSPPQMLTTVNLGDGKISPIPNSVGITKLVQIPSQSLHSMIGNPPVLTTAHGLQLAHHGIPTVMVATSSASDNKKQGTKPNLTDFFKTQSLHQSLNIVKPGTSTSGAVFKQPTLLVTSGAKTITLTAPLNGLATTRTSSLPSSPVEAKLSLGRTMSNPFFVPQKEPPKYDEAVRNKHNSQQGSGATELNNGTVPNKIPVKSQAMDDVLEILIRTGELPPSAAQEPPPTPKTTTQTATIPISVSQSSVSMTTTTTTTTVASYAVTSSEQYTGLSSSFTVTAPQDTVSDNVTLLLNSPQQVSSHCVKQESSTPPPLMVANVLSPDTSTHDLLDINDYMLNQDLNSMDWTSDQSFTLDLNDTTSMHMQTDQEMKCDGVNDFLNVPLLQGGNNKVAPHGSEPDLTGLGLTDPDNCANNQMDVSDWLDVIMPSTGLTPLSANPPVSFPSDPILTPKTQQEVLELFNFDDTDFNTPTDLHSGINWEKLTETTGSS
ncbi:myocardin-related transcription factor B-like [Ylistrum balloti]|uniref:myocardin-related transcription factor B-like n=1 Tax=Ylistrum balloti TaxID=509963 RepID=UPI002905AB3A|nr:myocardin-related transcription factor B-like [Ylistrum balloti]